MCIMSNRTFPVFMTPSLSAGTVDNSGVGLWEEILKKGGGAAEHPQQDESQPIYEQVRVKYTQAWAH